MHYKIFLYTLLLLSILNNVYGQNLNNYGKINNIENEAENLVAEIENNKNDALKKHQKNISQILEKTDQTKLNKNYQETQNWLKKNQDNLFAKQTQKLPKIDYDITDEQRKNDVIAKLLHNYRFKPDEIKQASISHYPLMIFVSSSIPKQSLKDLMYQAKKAGAVLVFKGFIGSFKNTQEYLANISKEEISAIIDPRLFDLFQIEVVPTFVILNDVLQDCEKNNCRLSPVHDRIAGNITLQYALEQFAQDAKENSLVFEFLKKIKGDNEL